MYIKKEITTSAEDYKQLVHFTEYRQKKSNIMMIAASCVAAAIVITLTILNIIPPVVGIVAAVIFLSEIPITIIRVNKKVKDGVKYGKVVLNTTRTLEITGMGIRIYGGRTATDVTAKWDTIFAIYELKNCFLLYLTHDSAFCINKSQLLMTDIYEMRKEFIKRLKNRFYKRCKY